MKCHNNWLDLSWEGLAQRLDRQNLEVKVKIKATRIMHFDRACDLVAEEIADTHQNLYLALSGGSDSEYVAKCLLRNNIPFTPLIIDLDYCKHNDQKYESWHALAWCRYHNIEPLRINVSVARQVQKEQQNCLTIKPRLYRGMPMTTHLVDAVEDRDGYLITGSQLEYYPDWDQMTYLEAQLKDYQGFVMQESDIYLETLIPDRHPWAFFYWTPEVMASFVAAWDENKIMQDNKAKIYGTSPRPKYSNPADILTETQIKVRHELVQQKWGTRDCALLGNKEQLLNKLLG